MQQVKVIVLPEGKRAKEINPMMKPSPGKPRYADRYDKWKLLEDSCRTFEISYQYVTDKKLILNGYVPGTKWRGEVLGNGKVKLWK